jgi:hypothetical protein
MILLSVWEERRFPARQLDVNQSPTESLGDHMAQWNGLRRTLFVILSAGAFGASVVLALASSDALAASNQTTVAQPTFAESVSTRLQAIRAGVSDMSGSTGGESEGDAKATPGWWGNGGWGNGWHQLLAQLVVGVHRNRR